MTGFINEREEQALLHQFHLQALKEGVQLPRSMHTAQAKAAMANDPHQPEGEEEEVLDAPPPTDRSQDQPMSLQDFHKMRSTSGGSNLFGHKGMEAERSRSSSGRSPQLGSPTGHSGTFSAPTSPWLGNDETEEGASNSFSESDGFSHPEDLSFNHDLRSMSPSSPPAPPAARPRPPKASDAAPESLRVSRDDLQRLSRVLDDMVDGFTAASRAPNTLERRPSSSSSSSRASGGFSAPKSPSQEALASLHARSSSRTLLLEQQQGDEQEEVDPLLSRSRGNSPVSARNVLLGNTPPPPLSRASSSASSSASASPHLSIPPSSSASTSSHSHPQSQGTLTSPVLPTTTPAAAATATPSPPRIETPDAPSLAPPSSSTQGTPRASHSFPEPPFASVLPPDLSSAASLRTPTPTNCAPTPTAGPLSPSSAFQAMFPSPGAKGAAPPFNPLDSPITRFPQDHSSDHSPAETSVASSHNNNAEWSTADLELYNHSPMPPAAETMSGTEQESFEARGEAAAAAAPGSLSEQRASEESVLSSAPSDVLAASPKRASRLSFSSIGSSYHGDEDETASLCEEVAWTDEASELPRPAHGRSSSSVSQQQQQQQQSARLRQPSTSQTTLESDEPSHGDGRVADPLKEELSPAEQAQFLQGLCISDLTDFQSKLVLSASQSTGGRLLHDPSPAIGERALFSSLGPEAEEGPDETDASQTPQPEQLTVNPLDSAGCSTESEQIRTPSLLGSVESPTTDMSAPPTPPINKLLDHDLQRTPSLLSREASVKSKNGSLSSRIFLSHHLCENTQGLTIESPRLSGNAGAVRPESAQNKPDRQSTFRFPPVQNPTSPGESPVQVQVESPAQVDRKNSLPVDVNKMIEAEAQIKAATAALKDRPSQPQSTGSGFGQMMRRRKSSKNLKSMTISTPTLVASTNKEYEPVPPVPSLPNSAQLSASQGSNAKHAKKGSGDHQPNTNGLQRFLTRLRKKADGPPPQSRATLDFASRLDSSSSFSASPTQLPTVPASAPYERDEFQADRTFASPSQRAAPLPAADPPAAEASFAAAAEVKKPSTPPPPPPPEPSYGGRVPVSYDVVKSRKRAGSVSQQSSETASPPVAQEAWTPVDPETSMASWRTSLASYTSRPESSAESVRKLKEAADALGLDPSKVDQLVADAATPPIPEDAEFTPSQQRPKSNVVRRTIIVGNNARLSQMLMDAPEIFSSQSPPPSAPAGPAAWSPSRPVPAPALRRTQTYSQASSTLPSRQGESRHRKISSESASRPMRPMLVSADGASFSYSSEWFHSFLRATQPHSASTGHVHVRQSSLDSLPGSQRSKSFKPLALASSLPPSTSNNSLLSVASASSRGQHRRSTKLSRQGTLDEEDEVLASGELPTSGKATSRRMSTRGDVQPGDRLEINEMDDGSFFWQVVRSKLRTERPISEVSSFTGFHSRTSSADSEVVPETPSQFAASRIARPSILDPKRDAKSSNDMRLVWAPQQTGHRRLRSTEGVGKLPYIRRHQEEQDNERGNYRHSHYSVNSDVEVFEADDEMVSHLIEDVSWIF